MGVAPIKRTCIVVYYLILLRTFLLFRSPSNRFAFWGFRDISEGLQEEEEEEEDEEEEEEEGSGFREVSRGFRPPSRRFAFFPRAPAKGSS